MRLYRISLEKHGKDLSGTGARLFGGRWNPKGAPAVYTSESPALAALEFLVHMPTDIAPEPLVLLEIEIPDTLNTEEIKLSGLDKDWNIYPFPQTTVKVGEEWIRENKTIALKVPSCALPYGKGWNFILNPLHPEFSRIKIIGLDPFKFEKRVLKR